VARFVELGHALEAELAGATGREHVVTRLHAPLHPFDQDDARSRIPLSAMAGVPGIVVDAAPEPGGLTLDLDKETVRDRAVLIRTGWDERWGTERYWEPGPYLAPETLELLVSGGSALVGVDFSNVDGPAGVAPKVRARLLRAGVLVVEHLCNLRGLPQEGFRFFAVPLRIAGGTSPVRAFVELAASNGAPSSVRHLPSGK
jgi:kynurenine formamidase